MSRAKQYILFIAPLILSTHAYAQKDSVQALFNPPKLNVHYSYLQWELGYNGVLFSNTYIDGISLDLAGIVFNDDVDIAFGFDQGGKNTNGYNNVIANNTIETYSCFYIKAEPMLFPEKLVNISMPVKFGISSFSYSDTSTAGYGRRARRKPVSFPVIEPGFFAYVNIFPKVNLGAGISYRVALKTSSTFPISDYDNFSFSVMMRLKLYTGARKVAAKNNNYYAPPGRFQ